MGRLTSTLRPLASQFFAAGRQMAWARTLPPGHRRAERKVAHERRGEEAGRWDEQSRTSPAGGLVDRLPDDRNESCRWEELPRTGTRAPGWLVLAARRRKWCPEEECARCSLYPCFIREISSAVEAMLHSSVAHQQAMYQKVPLTSARRQISPRTGLLLRSCGGHTQQYVEGPPLVWGRRHVHLNGCERSEPPPPALFEGR